MYLKKNCSQCGKTTDLKTESNMENELNSFNELDNFNNADMSARKWYEDVGDAANSILGGVIGGLVDPFKDKSTVVQTTGGGVQTPPQKEQKDNTNLFLFAGGALVLVLIGFIFLSKK